MKLRFRHLALGMSTGVTAFAIVVPIVHLLAALAVFAGVEFGPWDNPIGIFIFLVTMGVFGTFPWGLWIIFTDARRGDMFHQGHEVVEYLLAAVGAFLVLTILVCTRLQAFYVQYRWFLTPAVFVCAVALSYWRWRAVWGFPRTGGVRGVLKSALDSQPGS